MIRQDTDHTHHHKNNLFCPFIDILIIYLSLPEPLICSFLESNSMISVEISFSNSIVVWRFTLDVLCIRKIRKMYCMYSYFYFFSCSFFSLWCSKIFLCTTYFLFREIPLAMFRVGLLVTNYLSFPLSENF